MLSPRHFQFLMHVTFPYDLQTQSFKRQQSNSTFLLYFQAYQCVGRCYFPLSDHLSPTKYAIIKGLLHSAYPDEYSRACCVPTKLDPISILYIDEQGVPTYKYKYDGMVVSECGCR